MSFPSYRGTPFAGSLLPIIPCDATLTEKSKIAPENLGKVPGLKYASGWSGFPAWTATKIGEGVFPVWDSWYPKDEQTIGLQSRLFLGVDGDVNEEWQAQVIRAVAFQVFGETIVRSRSDGSPRILLMYRLEQAPDFIHKFRRVYGNGTSSCPDFAVEILGAGQQYLIEGKHLKGGTYVWETHPLEYGCENIPRISPAKLVEFIKKLDEAFALVGVVPQRPKQLGGGSGTGKGASAIGPEHPEVASLDELTKVLGFFSVNDPQFEGYDDWERVCRAIKTACGGDETFYEEVYLHWQRENPDNDKDKVRAKWESHTDSQMGFGYLVNIAAQRGYIPSVEGLFDNLDDAGEPSETPSQTQYLAGRHSPIPKPMPEGFALNKIPRRSFVLGRRLMAGAVTLGVGAPGAGKSNLAILTSLAIATGQPLTGEEVHKTGPVWIHNNEDSLDELHRRVGGMLKSHGIDFDDVRPNILMSSGLDEPLIVAIKQQKDIVMRAPAVAAVIAWIKDKGIVHMVIDPLVSTHRGVSENSNEEAEQVMGTIRHIAHETGCSIDLIHHSLKSLSGNTEIHAGNMHAARGASSLTGVVRIVYTLAPMSTDTAKKMKLTPAQAGRLLRLDHGKANYAARDTNIRWFELETFEIGNGDPFGTDGPPVPSDTIAVPKPWNPPAKQLETSKAVEHVGKLQQVRDVVAGAMSLDRCKLTDLLPSIEQAFNLKSSAARALLMDAIPEAGEVTAEVAEQTYLLKLDRVKPVPPGRLYVVRKRFLDQEAKAA